MSDHILVTGASGHLGRRTVELLLEKDVSPSHIIAVTRDPSKLTAFAEKGVQVRQGNFDDPEGLQQAFDGADRIAIISTDAVFESGKRLAQQKAAVEAAKLAGVKHIFYTSMPNPSTEAKVIFAGDHRGTEEAIKASGLDYTILRNGWYQENLFMNLPQAFGMGQWFTSSGEGKTAHISREDCALALATALTSNDVAGKIFTLTGGDALTNAEIGALAAELVGKPLVVVNLTDEQLAEGMKGAGVPEALIPLLISFEAHTRAGLVNLVTNDFKALTGREPLPLRQFISGNTTALAG